MVYTQGHLGKFTVIGRKKTIRVRSASFFYVETLEGENNSHKDYLWSEGVP